MSNQIKRVLNWRPSLPDHRDFLYEKIAKPIQLPPMVDLRPLCSPILDQGDLGSCSGHAMAGMVEFLELNEIRAKAPGPQEYVLGQFAPVSRMFIYYVERSLEGTVSQDAGVTTLRDGCKAVQQVGVPRELLWAYEDSLLAVKPSAPAYAEAAKHKVSAYYALNGLTQMKECLAHGFPFCMGISDYDSFMSDAVAASGIVPMPAASESIQGGHAVDAVGYDDSKQWFIMRNSWGTGWGAAGYFYLPYQYVQALADDFFTLRKVAAGI